MRPGLADDEVMDRRHRRWVFRHPALIRLCHWINVFCLAILLMSGLQIFNAHPALYWGSTSNFDAPIASIGVDADATVPRGVVAIGSHEITTTGVLGVSKDTAGTLTEQAFPSWITLPGVRDLATGRRWHFLVAWVFVVNGLVYLAYGVASGQLRARYVPSRDQIQHFGASVKDHLLLRFPEGAEAKRYNVIQKLTYVVVVLGLLPLQLMAGLAMSPAMNSVAPWLLDLFGGRQTARTIHFVVAVLLVLFVLVHVALVVVSGLWNNMRGMITGWFVIAHEDREPTR